MDDAEREARAKIKAELEAARDLWAPDDTSPYRLGIDMALRVVAAPGDRPLMTHATT